MLQTNEERSRMKKKHFVITRIAQWFSKYSTISVSSNDLSFSYIVKYSGKVSRFDHLPMLVVLHGDGDNVDDFYETALDRFKIQVRIVLIKGPILHECGDVWPFSADQYAMYGQAVSQVVDALAIKYSTVNKPILLGFSGGGAMAYYQAVKHGDSYSYIFPVSGLLYQEQLGDDSSQVNAKVYAYHGKSDTVVPFSEGKNAFKLLKKNGVSVCFTAFEGDHHAVFSEMKSEITQAVEQKISCLYSS